jgi:hypothetical protein
MFKKGPRTCMPRRAKIRMKRKRRSRREMMDFMLANRDTTRLRRLDQYLPRQNILASEHFNQFMRDEQTASAGQQGHHQVTQARPVPATSKHLS